MSYLPMPIPTESIALPPELAVLGEALARNTHEVWADRRMSEGWTYGAKRDDEARTHPGLVPYDDLTESEKDYDRATALETVKLILALGFRIQKPATLAR